jgi:hypothetical protein
MTDNGNDDELSVLVAGDHLDRMDEVVERLRGAGLRIGSVLGALGTVTGRASPENVETLRAVHGVAAVERARDFQLPSPDAPIQ